MQQEIDIVATCNAVFTDIRPGINLGQIWVENLLAIRSERQFWEFVEAYPDITMLVLSTGGSPLVPAAAMQRLQQFNQPLVLADMAARLSWQSVALHVAQHSQFHEVREAAWRAYKNAAEFQ